MKKEFIPYEQALELKELGFSYQCFAAQKDNLIDYGSEMYDFIYNADLTDKTDGWVALPLYQQAFRWFREKYLVDAEIYLQHELGHKFYHYLVLQLVRGNIEWKSKNKIKFITYEEAELACLKKLIEIAKNK